MAVSLCWRGLLIRMGVVVLEAEVSGATVLRADATDAYSGHWGAVRVLASQLLDALPDLALKAAQPHISVLGHVLPELLSRFEDSRSSSAQTSVQTEQRELVESRSSSFDRTAEVWGRGFSTRPPPPKTQSSIPLQTFDNPLELRPRVQEALRHHRPANARASLGHSE